MLRIRFKRAGRKNQAAYRVVVSERIRSPFAKAKEDIGWYNPHNKGSGLDKDRAKYWLSVGAQPSDTVHNLFVKEGIVDGKKIAVHGTRKNADEATQMNADQGKATGEAAPLGHSSATGEAEADAVPQPQPTADQPSAGEENADAPQAQVEEVVKEEPKVEEAPASDESVADKPADPVKSPEGDHGAGEVKEPAPASDEADSGKEAPADPVKSPEGDDGAGEAPATDEETADKKES